MKYPDIYENSSVRKKLSQNFIKRLAFLDIDSTLSGNNQASSAVRKKLEEKGFVISFVTSRTEEMVMSCQAFEKSKKYLFSRPKPLLNIKNNRHYYIDPQITESKSLVDPDIIIGSSGTQILIKQLDGGYQTDKSFLKHLYQQPDAWRKKTLKLLEKFKPKFAFRLSAIEKPEHYTKQITNVFPPQFRIKLEFAKVAEKEKFQEILSKIDSVHVVDDSNYSRDKLTLYLMPKNSGKAQATEHTIDQICREFAITQQDLEILIAGNSFPDLEMGLHTGLRSQVTFILVGNLRVSESLLKQTKHFTNKRKFVIGDQLFPGTKGPETILAYLNNPV